MPLGPPPESIDDDDKYFELDEPEEPEQAEEEEHPQPILPQRRSVRTTTTDRPDYRQLAGFKLRKQNN